MGSENISFKGFTTEEADLLLSQIKVKSTKLNLKIQLIDSEASSMKNVNREMPFVQEDIPKMTQFHKGRLSPQSGAVEHPLEKESQAKTKNTKGGVLARKRKRQEGQWEIGVLSPKWPKWKVASLVRPSFEDVAPVLRKQEKTGIGSDNLFRISNFIQSGEFYINNPQRCVEKQIARMHKEKGTDADKCLPTNSFQNKLMMFRSIDGQELVAAVSRTDNKDMNYCSLHCGEGRKGKKPNLECVTCLRFTHSQCIGFPDWMSWSNFVCHGCCIDIGLDVTQHNGSVSFSQDIINSAHTRTGRKEAQEIKPWSQDDSFSRIKF